MSRQYLQNFDYNGFSYGDKTDGNSIVIKRYYNRASQRPTTKTGLS